MIGSESREGVWVSWFSQKIETCRREAGTSLNLDLSIQRPAHAHSTSRSSYCFPAWVV